MVPPPGDEHDEEQPDNDAKRKLDIKSFEMLMRSFQKLIRYGFLEIEWTAIAPRFQLKGGSLAGLRGDRLLAAQIAPRAMWSL